LGFLSVFAVVPAGATGAAGGSVVVLGVSAGFAGVSAQQVVTSKTAGFGVE
jgi:hypothetical protein